MILSRRVRACLSLPADVGACWWRVEVAGAFFSPSPSPIVQYRKSVSARSCFFQVFVAVLAREEEGAILEGGGRQRGRGGGGGRTEGNEKHKEFLSFEATEREGGHGNLPSPSFGYCLFPSFYLPCFLPQRKVFTGRTHGSIKLPKKTMLHTRKADRLAGFCHLVGGCWRGGIKAMAHTRRRRSSPLDRPVARVLLPRRLSMRPVRVGVDAVPSTGP